MWTIKEFKTRDDMNNWLFKHESSIQFVEIFVNNGYALEFRKLRRIY